MRQRDMTDEERQKFEKDQLHHENEEREVSGPASEEEINQKRNEPRAGPVLPSPD